MRALIYIVTVLALVAPVNAQNRLTGAQSPTRLVSRGCPYDEPQPVLVPNPAPMFVQYCSAVGKPEDGGWPEPAVAMTWKHYIIVDGQPEILLTNVNCAFDATAPNQIPASTPYKCTSEIPPDLKVRLTNGSPHAVSVLVDVPLADGTRGRAASIPRTIESSTGCQYAAPGSTVMTTRPLYRVDPVNGSIQGFNPKEGQAARIAQLRSWGWKVEWQFVDGSFRTDKVDRVYLMIFCDPS